VANRVAFSTKSLIRSVADMMTKRNGFEGVNYLSNTLS
jgi:hypothetical protein